MKRAVTFTRAEADQFRAEKFDPYFRGDVRLDHIRKSHSSEQLAAYSRRQLFWLLDRDLIPGYKLEIVEPPPEPAPEPAATESATESATENDWVQKALPTEEQSGGQR